MKKFAKILAITLASFVGVFLLVLAVALWIVFTPARMTPLVRQVADQYIVSDHQIGEVELTFFSTFPDFGLRVERLTIVQPTPGAQSDTLISAPKAVAAIDILAFLRDEDLVVRELSLYDAQVNAFIAADGSTNFDVFAFPSDTTTTVADTSAFTLPFKDLRIDKLSLEARTISFLDLRDSIDAALYNTSLAATAKGWSDITLVLSSADVNASLSSVPYAKHLCVSATLPLAIAQPSPDSLSVRTTSPIVLGVNEYLLSLSGAAAMGNAISMDLNAELSHWQIAPLLALLPPTLTDLISDIQIDGDLSAKAAIKGVYNDTLIPVVDARLSLANASGAYAGLPYALRDVSLLADAHVDLNDSLASTLDLHSLSATTRQTSLSASGRIEQLLADMALDLQVQADVLLSDMAYFLPDSLVANGRVDGQVGLKMRLSDLMAMRLDQGAVSADLRLHDIAVAMDSMQAYLPSSRLTCQLPNPRPSRKSVRWLSGTLALDSLSAQMPGMEAAIGSSTLFIEASDVLSSSPLLCANLSLESTSQLTAAMDSMAAHILAPRLQAYAEYDTHDTTAIPTLDAQVAFADLQAHYTDIQAHLASSSLSARLSHTRRDKSAPRLQAALSTASLQAQMGADTQVLTDSLSLDVAARYNPKGENLILQWNPRLDVRLRNGVAKLPDFLPIYIPEIGFAYSNKECLIDHSQIRVGNSDFALSGEVHNIGPWLRKKATLQGELHFVSDHTDVNELLLLCSADSGSEEQPTAAPEVAASEPTPSQDLAQLQDPSAQEPKPFLVPTDVDLTLFTHIKEAHVFDETAHNLKGNIYVRNGVLVLEEVGFICEAAKMQLTAMYKTPRRNHIYVGMDYHMVDVDIERLIQMIPQIDSMMPMLSSFKGKAEFHLAGETFTNASYRPKISTMRGAASLFAKDLVVLDSKTFSTISKLLLFNKKTENKIDSLSAEATLYKSEIDVFPFCVSLDNFMVALGGRHNLDMTFDYDVNVLSPIYLGVNVSGNLDDLNIKLAKCKYAQDFKPRFHRKVDTQTAELKASIRRSMQRNVKF